MSSSRRLFLAGWALFLLLVYATIGIVAYRVNHGEKIAAEASHRARMSPGVIEQGETSPDKTANGGNAIPVSVGLYLDGIEAMSIQTSRWNATFYIWFRWQGDRNLNPGADFQLVDGRVERRDLQDEYHGADGTNYQRFRVVAQMTKFFNTTRVPLDDHMLNIYVEDRKRDLGQLRYVADPATNVSSRVRISGYTILGHESVAKTHTYRSAYGDPRLGSESTTTFSMFTFGLSIKRDGMGVYLKLFIGLFAGLALAFASYGLRASDAGPRFSMLAGAYFGAVANSYLAGTLVPSTGQFGLVEYVTFTGLFTIFLSLIAVIISMYIWNRLNDRGLSKAFDLTTVTVLALSYVAVNIVIPFSA